MGVREFQALTERADPALFLREVLIYSKYTYKNTQTAAISRYKYPGLGERF